MKKGDIYLVSFPFSDLSETKKRPALVLGNLKGDNTVFAQISTKNKLTKEYQISLTPQDTKSGDIRFNSFIYSDMLFTLHKDLEIKKIGEVKLGILTQVDEKLKLVFDL